MADRLGWQSENSLNIYPFKDGCTLIPIGSTVSIPNDLFVDFQFTAKLTDIKRVALESINYHGVGNPSFDLTFRIFEYTNGSWSSLVTSIILDYEDIVPYEFITNSGNYGTIKIVFGKGITDYSAKGFRTVRFNVNINSLTAEFSPSTIVLYNPTVNSIAFQNINSGTVETVSLANNATVYLNAGANILGSLVDNTAELEVIAGAGTGLYDNCPAAATDVIRKINNIGPDTNDNYLFSTDNCYNTVLHTGIYDPALPDNNPNGLDFIHTCKPKCSQDEILAFAYYANRINDGIMQISDYINRITAEVQAKIDAFRNQSIYRGVISPYIEVQDSSVVSSSRIYVSIGVGIYDPNKEKLKLTLSVTPSGGVVDKAYFNSNPTYSHWVLEDKPVTLQEANSLYKLTPDINNNVIEIFTNRGIDCRDSIVSTFLTTLPSGTTNQTLITKLTQLNSTTGYLTSSAYNYYNILPSSKPYFNIRSRKGLHYDVDNNPTFYYQTISVDFFNTAETTSETTAFSATINNPTVFGFLTSEPAILKINNDITKQTTILTPTNVLSFTGKVIPYPQRATVTFVVAQETDYPLVDLSMSFSMTVDGVTTTVSNLIIP